MLQPLPLDVPIGANVPVFRLTNSRDYNEIVLSDECPIKTAFFCAVHPHPKSLGFRFMNVTERAKTRAMQGWGVEPSPPCTDLNWLAYKPGTVLQSEAIRVAWAGIGEPALSPDTLRSSTRNVNWATFVGCLVNPVIEVERIAQQSSFEVTNHCTAGSANIEIVVLDTTSRISFALQAPETRRWIEEFGAEPISHKHFVFEFVRQNIIGVDTPRNMNALMAGCPPNHGYGAEVVNHLRKDCGTQISEYLQSLGYVTIIASQYVLRHA